jgi:hypothetical protein
MPSRKTALPETIRRKNRVVGCIKLIAAAICVAAVLATGAIFQFRGIERRESEQLQLVTLKSAGKLAEHLSAIDQTLRQFRAADVATTDRIGLAARMLAIDPVQGHENDIFLFSANAKFIAGSVPLPSGADDVSERDWFKEAIASVPFTGLNVSACAQDPLGNDHGGVFSRQITDHGKLVGVIGTFLSDSNLQALQDILDPGTPSISLSLRRNDGSALGCNAPPAPAPENSSQPPTSQPLTIQPLTSASAKMALAKLGTLLSSRLVRLNLHYDDTVPPSTLHILAKTNSLNRLNPEDLLILACWPAIGLIFAIMFLMAIRNLFRRPHLPAIQPPTEPARPELAERESADWVWEIDATERLVGVAGNAPQHLVVPYGRRLDEIAGPIAKDDKRWDSVMDSIRLRKPFSGLHVPLVIPGRERLLRIYKLDGQPVTDTGGFWGTARLVWEEDLPRPPNDEATPNHSPLTAPARDRQTY